MPRPHPPPRDALTATPDASGVSVREATPHDAPLLAQMRLALEGEGGSESPADPGFRRSVIAWFDDHVGSESFRAWIAEEDGDAVSMGGLVLFSRPPYTGNPTGLEALVTSMYTVPERRGHGIGSLLLRGMLEAARELGAGRVVLYSSTGAVPLYRRFGFMDDGVRGAPMELWLDTNEMDPSDR